MSRILILSIHYRPEPNFVVSDIAERYAADGHEVDVLTTYPSYPFGRFYKGTGSFLPSVRRQNGVRVWRLPHYPDHSNSKLRRAVSYLSFSLFAALVAPFVVLRPDVVFVYQTPFSVGLGAIFFKIWTRCRTYFIYADLWPESFLAAKIPTHKFVYRAMYAYSQWINRFCDVLIATTPGMVRRFVDDGFKRTNILFIPLWVDATKSVAVAATPIDTDRAIVYAGNLGPAQCIETLIEGFASIEPELGGLRFDIYGTGSEERRLKELVEKLGAKHVRFLGRVSPDVAFAASQAALAQVVHLSKSPLFSMTIPSKLALALGTGRPILAGLAGDAQLLAKESGAALLFEQESPASFAAALRQLVEKDPGELAELGRNGQAYFESHLRFSNLIGQYSDLVAKEPINGHSSMHIRTPN